jgi:hypothetical protein
MVNTQSKRETSERKVVNALPMLYSSECRNGGEVWLVGRGESLLIGSRSSSTLSLSSPLGPGEELIAEGFQAVKIPSIYRHILSFLFMNELRALVEPPSIDT